MDYIRTAKTNIANRLTVYIGRFAFHISPIKKEQCWGYHEQLAMGVLVKWMGFGPLLLVTWYKE